MASTQSTIEDQHLKVLTTTWDKVLDKLRHKIRFVYCNNCDLFYRPQIGEYEDLCPICKIHQGGGMSSNAIVIIEQ